MVDSRVTTPSPLPSPSNSSYSLSERINLSTRPIHSRLNRLILARLPLALPPHTSNPSIYVSGLLYITPIYSSFESLWQTILDAPRLPTTLKPIIEAGIDACDHSLPFLDSKSPRFLPHIDNAVLIHNPKVCSRIHSLLVHLRLPGLLRVGRLRADISLLTGTPEHKIDEQLEAVSTIGKMAEFITHTESAVEKNPHILLAYAWVLYMALFSGGRYLRASLQSAGGSCDFWRRDLSPVRPYAITAPLGSYRSQGRKTKSESRSPIEVSSRACSRRRSDNEIFSQVVPGLHFFNFPGDEDGEDIKREFKKRFVEAEALLTNGEIEDIIDEAEEVFKFMVELVYELDSVIGTDEEDIKTAKLTQEHPDLTKFEDSIAVAQEKLVRKTRMMRNNLGNEIEEGKEGTRNAWEVVAAPFAKMMRYVDNKIIWKTMCGRPHEGECDQGASLRMRQWDDGLWIGAFILIVLMVFSAWAYTT